MSPPKRDLRPFLKRRRLATCLPDRRPAGPAVAASSGARSRARLGTGALLVHGVPHAWRTNTDQTLQDAIVDLLNRRTVTSTIYPSEAAKQVDPDGWHELMEPARRAARRLVTEGTVEITQGGKVVDSSTAKGPMRVQRTRCPPDRGPGDGGLTPVGFRRRTWLRPSLRPRSEPLQPSTSCARPRRSVWRDDHLLSARRRGEVAHRDREPDTASDVDR